MPMALPLIGAAFLAAGAVATAVGLGVAFTIGALAISWGAVLTVTGFAVMAVGMLTAKTPKPESTGQQINLKLDPQAPVPIAYGRTGTGGYMVYRDAYGAKNKFLALISVLSLGPIQSIDAYYGSDYLVNFSGNPTTAAATCTSVGGGSATSKLFKSKLNMRYQLGSTPATQTPGQASGQPLPGSPGLMSGLAHAIMWMEFDQEAFPSGLPKSLWVLKGVKLYDPRKDSTYPGGSGSHRVDQPATWEFSENPYLAALQWTLGVKQNGKRVYGIGAPWDEVDVGSFVAGANIADANGWKLGGVVTTADDKFAVLSTILQSGAGVPVVRGAQISCIVNTPKATVYTIKRDDIVGDVEVQNTNSWRDRKNTLTPRYREESQLWQIIAGEAISATTYVAEDGGEQKSQEVEFPLVQHAAQAHQLAAYELCNSREFLTFSIVCKPKLLGVRVGDCVTVTLSEIGASAVKCLVLSREFNPADATVLLQLKAENDGKHAFALGQSQTAPPSPSLGDYDPTVPEAPGETAWDVQGSTITHTEGVTTPALLVTGECDDPNATVIITEYRLSGDTEWTHWAEHPRNTTKVEITSVAAGQEYEVAVSYRTVRGILSERRVLGPVAAGELAIDWDAGVITGPNLPTRNVYRGAWEADTSYQRGDFFVYENSTYIVTTAHVSASGSPPPNANVALLSASGVSGLSNAAINVYKRSATAPAVPSAATTYTFATGVLTGLNNGWSQQIPSGTDPLYVTVASASNSAETDVIQPNEWASPVIYSGAGINSRTLFLYQRGTSSTPPTKPSADATYTFATGVLTGVNNGWAQSVPTSGGQFLFITTATALGVSATDIIASSEWSEVSIMAQDGSTGASGLNNATIKIFQRAASEPTLPSALTTYTFATGVLTGLNNGWSQTPPAANGQPLYVSVTTASANTATDTIAANEWATPIIDTGAGVNTAPIYLYQRSLTSTAPALPTASATYTFATGALTGVNNGWSQTVPASGGPYLFITTATALGVGATDTITSGEWAAANILAQDGATGQNGLNNATIYIHQRAASAPTLPSVSATYTFATGALAGLNNGWTQAVPANDGNPLWVSVATASNNAATDTITSGEWATPVLESGAGLNSASIFLYQRNTTGDVPALPSVSTTYNFTTGVLSGANNGWSQTIPSDSNGQYLFITTASALSATVSDTIAANEWAAARLMSRNGNAGAAAKLVSMTTSATSVGYTSAGVPKTQTIKITATRQNTTQPLGLLVYALDGVSIINGGGGGQQMSYPGGYNVGAFSGLGTVTLSSDGNTLTWEFTEAQFHTMISNNGTTGLVVLASVTDNSVTYNATVDVKRVNDGAKGDPGSAITIKPSALAFIFQNGVLTPSSQTLTFDAVLGMGTTGTIVWEVINPATGAVVSFTTVDSDTITVSHTQFGTIEQARVRASISGVGEHSVVVTRQDAPTQAYYDTINYTRSDFLDSAGALLNAAANGVISKSEKRTGIIPRWTAIQSSYTTYRAEGVSRGVSVSSLDTYYTQLSGYVSLHGLTNTSYASAIDPTEFRDRFANYLNAEDALVAAMNAAAAQTAVYANITGQKPPVDAGSPISLTAPSPIVQEGNKLTNPAFSWTDFSGNQWFRGAMVAECRVGSFALATIGIGDAGEANRARWYCQGVGSSYAIFQNGSYVTSGNIATLPVAAAGDHLLVAYDGSGYLFFRNGVLYHRFAATPNVASKLTGSINQGSLSDVLVAPLPNLGGYIDTTTGKVADQRFNQTAQVMGFTNSYSGTVPSYTGSSGSRTVNIPSHNRLIGTTPGTQITLTYPSGSTTYGNSVDWWAYVDDPNMTGGGTVQFTTNPDNLVYPGRLVVSSGRTPAADPATGGGGYVGTGGGAGGGYRYYDNGEIM